MQFKVVYLAKEHNLFKKALKIHTVSIFSEGSTLYRKAIINKTIKFLQLQQKQLDCKSSSGSLLREAAVK